MIILNALGDPIFEPIGTFGLLDLSEGLISLSVVLVIGVVAYRILKGQGIQLKSKVPLGCNDFMVMDKDILMQQKQPLDLQYEDSGRLPFTNFKVHNGMFWLFVLIALMVFVYSF